jgi:hypothetical protein
MDAPLHSGDYPCVFPSSGRLLLTCREQRAESREQRAESREQRAESREQKSETREQRAESRDREQRAKRPWCDAVCGALCHHVRGELRV